MAGGNRRRALRGERKAEPLTRVTHGGICRASSSETSDRIELLRPRATATGVVCVLLLLLLLLLLALLPSALAALP